LGTDASAASVFQRPLQRPGALLVAGRQPVDVAQQVPRPRHPRLVTEFLEDGDGALRHWSGVVEGQARIRLPERGDLLKPCVPLQTTVVELISDLDQLPRQRKASVVLAGDRQRAGKVEQQLSARRLAAGKEVGGPPEQAGGRGDVRASQRSPARGRQSRRRALREHLVGLIELGAVPERLLEVVAEDLLELDDVAARAALEPVREALVEARARLFR
jgi:hypothetical protein